jgi:hypothetical protein
MDYHDAIPFDWGYGGFVDNTYRNAVKELRLFIPSASRPKALAMVDEKSKRTITKLRLTLPHKDQSADNHVIDAEREAKYPALLHIDPKGEGGPKPPSPEPT